MSPPLNNKLLESLDCLSSLLYPQDLACYLAYSRWTILKMNLYLLISLSLTPEKQNSGYLFPWEEYL